MTAQSELIQHLQVTRRRMPYEVRLVFDYDDQYDKIIEFAGRLAGQPTDLLESAAQQRQWAQQLDEIADQIDQMNRRVSDWAGPAREAFDDAIRQLSEQARSLATVGRESSDVLSSAERGWHAGDELVTELVETSVNFAIRTLDVARRMAPLTGGVSMSTWVAVNLRQVAKLADEVEQATTRLGSFREHLTGLLGELTKASGRISDQMAALSQRVDD